MFANTFQSGFISVFYSVGSNPLSLWDKSVKNGHIRRVVDDEVKSLVLELSGTNVATTYITCPIKARASLGIKLPFLVMVIKNMKKYFTFEVQIADDKDMRRRFRVSNFQSTTKVRPFCTTMPIGLSPGWNQIQFNLADFTRRAYGSTYIETIRVQIHANSRIRRIYFSDRLYGDDEMPQEYKLFLPIPGTHRKQDPRKQSKEAQRPSREVPEKKQSMEAERKIELIEEEIPSVAPPATPIEEESPRSEAEPERTPSVEQHVEEVHVEVAEPGDETVGEGQLPREGGGGDESTEAATEDEAGGGAGAATPEVEPTTEEPSSTAELSPTETEAEATDTEAPVEEQ